MQHIKLAALKFIEWIELWTFLRLTLLLKVQLKFPVLPFGNSFFEQRRRLLHYFKTRQFYYSAIPQVDISCLASQLFSYYVCRISFQRKIIHIESRNFPWIFKTIDLSRCNAMLALSRLEFLQWKSCRGPVALVYRKKLMASVRKDF